MSGVVYTVLTITETVQGEEKSSPFNNHYISVVYLEPPFGDVLKFFCLTDKPFLQYTDTQDINNEARMYMHEGPR